MRFGKLEPSVLPDVASASDSRESILAPFADSMPIHLNIFVNAKQASLPPLLPTCRPNMDGRRYARPVNITPLVCGFSHSLDAHLAIYSIALISIFVYVFISCRDMLKSDFSNPTFPHVLEQVWFMRYFSACYFCSWKYSQLTS